MVFEANYFWEGVARINQANPTPSPTKNIIGGVIPHHLLPSYILSDFFTRLTARKPETIILIGPNHLETGLGPLLTSQRGWSTPFGTVWPDQPIINSLVSNTLIRIDENTVANEHSVAGIMPYLKYYLPQTKVVPIILSSTLGINELETLATHLTDYVGSGGILLASIDFSHYLTNPEAQRKDQETLKLINGRSYRQLTTLKEDHLDSPPSLILLLKTMERINQTELVVLNHTNSGEILKDDTIPTTSYFSLIFFQSPTSR